MAKKEKKGFGKGDRVKLDSPHWARRSAVMKLVLEDKSHRSVEEKIDRVVKLLYGEATPPNPVPVTAPPAPANDEARRWQASQLLDEKETVQHTYQANRPDGEHMDKKHGARHEDEVEVRLGGVLEEHLEGVE